MSKKILMEKKEHTKVIVHSVPAVVEKYVEEVPITVYECDFCTRAKLPTIDEYPKCIGCGKHACYFCLHDSLEDLWFQIGEEEDTGGDDTSLWRDQSDDFRFASFRICKDCLENPPTKLRCMMATIKYRKYIQELMDEATGDIIDEIEALEKSYD